MSLRNNGDFPLGAGVSPGAGRAVGSDVLLRFEPRSVALAAGQSAFITVRARTGKWLVSGTPVPHNIQLNMLGGGKAKPVDVNLLQQPVLPAWPFKIARIAVPLLAVLLGVAAFSWWKNRPAPSPTLLATRPPWPKPSSATPASRLSRTIRRMRPRRLARSWTRTRSRNAPSSRQDCGHLRFVRAAVPARAAPMTDPMHATTIHGEDSN